MRFFLLVALVSCGQAEKVSKSKWNQHQREIQARLKHAAQHVRNGGPTDEKLYRMHDVLELHNGFVTDMLATYRPSKLAKYIAKASRFIAMMGPPAHEEARGTRRLDGGACFDSYGEEWMCVMQSCSCDRAIDMSEAGGSQSGPDISTACDDTSEYMTYACDVSMQQTECKIDNDLDCVTDDDWVLNWFKGGLPANASYSYSFDVEYGPDGDDTLPSKEIEIAEGGMNDDWDDWEGPQDCGGSTAERSWSMQCCGKSTCQYADAACEADPMQCAPFRTNFMYETTLNDGVGVGDETTMPPSPFPTYDSCAGYGLGDNVGQDMNSLSGQNPAESYLGNSVHEWDDVIQDDTTNCPNFDVQEFGADAATVSGASNDGKHAVWVVAAVLSALIVGGAL